MTTRVSAAFRSAATGGPCGVTGCTRHTPRDQGRISTCPAYARPAPNPNCTSTSPLLAAPSSMSRWVASGIEAAEVLPVSLMSRAMTTSSPRPSCLASSSMMRMFAWWGAKTSMSSTVSPDWTSISRTFGGVPHGPAEDGAAVLLEGGPLGGAVAEVDEGTRHPDGVPVVPVAAPHGRADLGLLARADDGCARPVAQQERDGTIGGRDEVRELLRTDHQHVAGAAGTDQGIGLADPVTEAGAGCGDVVGDHVRAAQLPGQQRRERGGRVREGDGGDDDRVQGLQLDAGGLDGLAGGGEGEVLDADVLAGAGAGDDPGALADPLVGGVDRADQIVVGDLQVAAGGAVGQHLGAGDGRMGTQAHGHVSSPRCR